MNVPFLTTFPTLKACNSSYMQYYFKRFFVLHSFKVIFSFLIKKSRQKAIEIETAFFHSLGNPKGHTHWNIPSMLDIFARGGGGSNAIYVPYGDVPPIRVYFLAFESETGCLFSSLTPKQGAKFLRSIRARCLFTGTVWHLHVGFNLFVFCSGH